MPKKNIDPHSALPQSALAEELADLHRILSEATTAFCRPDAATAGKTLAVARLVQGLSFADWKKISQARACREWFALPLDGDALPYLAHIQATLAELAYQTDHDPLTSLANRRAFDNRLGMELQRIAREGTNLTLAVLDLDNFKLVNDRHGHPCGDTVLTTLAQILLKNKRAYDLAARMGGEEFAVLLPGAGLHNARVVIERIQEELRSHPFTCGNGPFAVTVSAGLVACRGRTGTTPASFVELADKALYEAKAKGKDTIVTNRIEDSSFAPKKTMVHSDEKKFLFAREG
ncbi:MAG: GGDEF domain-containing protein [Desulfovibrionaceae bacterium]